MGIIISGLVVITMLLAASGVMFSTFLDSSVSGAQSLKDLTQVKLQRLGSSLDISSAVFDSGSAQDLTVNVNHTGSQSVARFADMDVIVEYTNTSNDPALTRLKYNAAAIGNNEWTVTATGVQPDSFNPRFWDPDESLVIDMRVDPAVKSGTSALIVVGSPWAVSDQTTVTAP